MEIQTFTTPKGNTYTVTETFSSGEGKKVVLWTLYDASGKTISEGIAPGHFGDGLDTGKEFALLYEKKPSTAKTHCNFFTAHLSTKLLKNPKESKKFWRYLQNNDHYRVISELMLLGNKGGVSKDEISLVFAYCGQSTSFTEIKTEIFEALYYPIATKKFEYDFSSVWGSAGSYKKLLTLNLKVEPYRGKI